MRDNTSKTSVLGTVIASLAIVLVLLIFLLWAWGTLAATAATFSNDLGLMALRLIGDWSNPWIMLLMFACAVAAFVFSFMASREVATDESQVDRFRVIGLAFVVVALMFLLFGWIVETWVIIQ